MKQHSASPLKWAFFRMKQVWPGVLALCVLGICYSIVGVSFAAASKNVIDAATGQSQGNLLRECLVLAALVAAQLALYASVSAVDVRVRGRLEIYFRKELFSSLVAKDFRRVSGYHTGELLNRMTSDISVITETVGGILPDVLYYVTQVLASFALLFYLEPLLALVCLVLGPIVFVAARLYRKKIKRLHKAVQESDGKTRSFMQEALQNILVIKSFRSERRVTEQSTGLQEENYRLKLRRNRISILANVMFLLVTTAGYFAALAYGAYRMAQGLMTFGTLTAILQLAGQLQTPFERMAALVPRYFAMLASCERVMELEELPEDNAAELSEKEADELYQNLAVISARDIAFSYDKEEVLSHVNFSLPRGSFAVVTGASGIGKSTLLKLLLGIFQPERGNLEMLLEDGTAVPVGAQTRALFSYVPQGNMILSGTVRENITFARPGVTEEEIIKAARTAEIWDEISQLPQGLDTRLGEGGMGLSEGQVQRLAVSRALLSHAPILLLDECTSALDEETESRLLANIKALRSKTVVIVSHKKAALSACDVHLTMAGGKIFVNSQKSSEKM